MPIAATREAAPDTSFLNARTDTYAMLAVLLNRPPDADLLRQLQEARWHIDLPVPLVDVWSRLREAARANSMAAIAKEFQAVFEGLGQGEVVPYASRYGEGLLMARPLARLRQDLAGVGIGRRPGQHEAEDHAGLVCETMALLASRRALTPADYARFFEDHVASWMFDFFSDVRNAPSACFYGAVAEMGTTLLHLERNYLAAAEAY